MDKKYNIKDFLDIKSSINPSFNYDGSQISFLNNSTGTYQVYLISSRGGKPEQVTFFDDPISFAVFSPVKNEIFFGKAEKGNEQTQFYLYSLETEKIEALTNNSKVKYNFGQYSRDGKYITYSQNERNGKDFDIYIMNMETKCTECVYDKGGSCEAVGFSPKNSYLVIRKRYSNLNVDLFLLSLKDKSIGLITSHEGDQFFGKAAWLPDESAFYTLTNKEKDFLGLSKYGLQNKKFEYLLNPNWDIVNVRTSFDGKILVIVINEDGYHHLKLYDTVSMRDITFSAPRINIIHSIKFSKDSKDLLFNASDSLKSSDVWLCNIENQKCNQITHSHQGVPAAELIEPTLFRLQSFDGLNIPAFLYLPKDKNKQSDGKYPVIINIHGGPEYQYVPAFDSLTQYFVYEGYAVIAPNVRGSSGYGKKYLALDDIEKRLDSVRDLAFLYDYIKTVPQLDSDRVVLMGGSYGGYMTLMGLAFYPDLWVGGVVTVGMANLITFLENTAPYRRAIREAEYGHLDKDRDLLHSISPINHVEKIKAPLLVIHGVNDPRVPLDEARQITKKLTELGRRAELLIYEDEGHGLSKLKNKLDAYPKVANFLEEIFSLGSN